MGTVAQIAKPVPGKAAWASVCLASWHSERKLCLLLQVMEAVAGSKCNDQMLIVMGAVVKLFVGDLVETGVLQCISCMSGILSCPAPLVDWNVSC